MSLTIQTDIISASILQSKFEAVVAEMEKTLINTAYSSQISVSRQCATALFTEQGKLIAISNPLYMYPMVMTAEKVIDYFLYDLSAEDVLLTNDPYGGGTRVQNFTMVAPVASRDSISLFVAACGQTDDFAGDIRGNLHPGATEIWAEGARCSPIRLIRDGKFRKDVMQTLSLNSRNPVALELDVDAMRAAVEIGRQRLAEMLNSYGTARLLAAVDWVLNYSERRTRALIEQIPEGRYEGRSVLAHDAQGGRNRTVRVALEIAKGSVKFDFTGTDAQSTSFVNATRAVSSCFAVLPLLEAFGGEVPCNAGAMRCVDIVAPQGTLVNPALPGPVGWGMQHVGAEIAEAVSQALDQALPGKVGQITSNAMLFFSVHHVRRHGRTVEQVEVFDYSNFGQGDSDATSEHDGWGAPGIAARLPLPSIELYESEREGRVEELEFAQDSAGAGTWRGSPGTRAVVSLPRPGAGELHLTAVVVPRVAVNAAVHCGLSGTQNAISVECDGTISVEDVLADWTLPENASITLAMGGGHGWGAPHKRLVNLVAADVADGLVSIEAARMIYGVVLEPQSFKVDETATARLRGLDIEPSKRQAGRR